MKTRKLFNRFKPSYGIGKDELANKVGLKTFDCAVPNEWIERHPNVWDNLMVVWCYDENQVFGRPVDIFNPLLKQEAETLGYLLQEYPPCNPKVLNRWYNEAMFQVTRDYIFAWQQVVENGGILGMDVFNEAHELYKEIKP